MRFILNSAAVTCIVFASHHHSLGATFEFELTDSTREPALETFVDLETSFRRIDTASVQIEGIFTPGIVTGATIPPLNGPVVPSDTVKLILRLGEVGTTWIDKQTYAIHDLQGMSGDIELSLPLRATETFSVPVFLPSGDPEPNYSFLHDGKFGFSFSWTHWLTLNLHVIEPPRFEITSFTLHVEGIAVPEPACLPLGVMIALALVHTRRICRHTD